MRPSTRPIGLYPSGCSPSPGPPWAPSLRTFPPRRPLSTATPFPSGLGRGTLGLAASHRDALGR
eukprot:14304310-Alexandrium_andersonii.AAC.1